MFLRIILNYILGYVRLKVEGYYIERFINICMSKNIFFWSMKREKSSLLYANVGIKEYKKIRPIAKKLKCRVRIEKKKGLPFIFNKYRKRKIFIALLMLVLLTILISSNYIWNIEITGLDKIQYADIAVQLEEKGLKIGELKGKIDTKRIIENIRLERNDIAWMGIEIEGTNAKVEIVETKEKPEIVNEEDFCNIVADKDCIITKISVQNGTARVKAGDIVKNGDILVEGIIEGKYMETIHVNSSAEIEGKTWHTKTKSENFKQKIEKRTGNFENKYAIKFNDFEINLYKTLSKFENYDTIREENKLSIFSDFYLPIQIIKITNYEKTTDDIEYQEYELKTKMIRELEEELNSEIGENTSIINKYVNYKKLENGLKLELVYETLESIGTKEKVNV